jgi:Holliday junction resolvasome RuvABC DNA-binding subunit
LELKDRLRPATGSPTSSEVGSPPWQGDVQAGLMSLGWNQRQADWAVTQVHKELSSTDATAPPEMAELLRAALRHLDRSGSP